MMQAILSRRSIRRFSNEPLPNEKLQELLHAAMQAPSAKNERPWEFLIIQDPDMRLRLSQTSPYSGAAKNAPTVIVLLCNKQAYLPKDDTFWQQDMSAAAENILLSAQCMGLGSVWLAVSPLPERMEYVSKTLDLPEGVIPFAILPVGYPEREKPAENRFDAARIFYDTYR